MMYLKSGKKQKSYLATLPFKNEGEIKAFPDKQKLRRFISRPAIREMLKEELPPEMRTLESNPKLQEEIKNSSKSSYIVIKDSISVLLICKFFFLPFPI